MAQCKKKFVVCKGDLFHRIEMKQRHGDFDYIGIFLNYPKVFFPLVEKGVISEKTQRRLDFKLLENLSIWFYRLNIKKDVHYAYLHDNSYAKLKSYFKKYRFWNFWLMWYIFKCKAKDSLFMLKRIACFNWI